MRDDTAGAVRYNFTEVELNGICGMAGRFWGLGVELPRFEQEGTEGTERFIPEANSVSFGLLLFNSSALTCAGDRAFAEDAVLIA